MKIALPRLKIKLIFLLAYQAVTFALLLILYLTFKATVQKLASWTAFGFWQQGKIRLRVFALGMSALKKLDIHEKNSISRLDLIDLSIRHLKLKKTRSFITIGGMSVGIAVIVFLVSIGYGLENLVISRIASLNEMKQADIFVQPGSKLTINDRALAEIRDIPHVEKALPQISVVGKIVYNASESDVAVYGVTADLLKQSAIVISDGKLFSSNDLTVPEHNMARPVANVLPANSGTEPTPPKEADNEPSTMALSSAAIKQAVVNKAMLEVMGLPASSAVGKKFSASFITTHTNNDGSTETLASVPADYTIVGVAGEDAIPFFYVPFVDLRSLGIDTYSQAKLFVSDKDWLADARKRIEVLGYTTQSVSDTVSQVNNLFATFRTILVILGLGALFVASLGMFNTLTVSLLERTREVGLMKSMGMRSFEVRELFLTESMIMGLFGGLLGLLLGIVAGKALSLGISALSLSQGGGLVDISSIPWDFGILILGVSLLVGFVTGLYPSRRATRISALNALRYE